MRRVHKVKEGQLALLAHKGKEEKRALLVLLVLLAQRVHKEK